MSPRSIRRAAERKARKEALRREKALALTEPGPASQIEPRSDETAVRPLPITSDDPAQYQTLRREFEERYRPATILEQQLVELICAAFWRMCRIPTLERALFAKGRREFADAFPDEQDPAHRALLIEGEVLSKYEKQVRNLHLQDARLHRRYEKLSAELRQLQQERLEKAAERPETIDPPEIEPPTPDKLGFEFSTRETQDVLEPLAAAATPIPAPELKQMEAQAA